MEFIYSIPTKEYYSDFTDEYFYDEKEIHFEPDDDELIDAIAEIIIAETRKCELNDVEHKFVKSVVVDLIKDKDLKDTFSEDYKEDLKEYFREDAMEMLK